MGMGTAACHAWTISKEGLEKVCPKEFKAIQDALDNEGMTWDEFALNREQDQVNGEVMDIGSLWEALQDSFQKATKVDDSVLILYVGYYDADSGDRYDDLENGHYFYVDNVEQLTPAAKKIESFLTEKQWTIFG
jgi:hypothetical protein